MYALGVLCGRLLMPCSTGPRSLLLLLTGLDCALTLHLGFRGSGFRGLGFRGLGFRGSGFRGLGV